MKAETFIHRGERRIRIDFPFDQTTIDEIKKIKDCRWSKTWNCWHIPYSKEAFRALKEMFPGIEYKKAGPAPDKVSADAGVPVPDNGGVHKQVTVRVTGRSIYVILPWNQADIQILRNIRYSRWDKKNFYWVIPHYPGNLDLIKTYFGERIASLTINEEIADESGKQTYMLAPGEVLLIRTTAGRLRLISLFRKEINDSLKSIPYVKWDKENKWWTFPYSELYKETITTACLALGLKLIYEEENRDAQGINPRPSRSDVPNYRECPAEYEFKLKEMRYSQSTIHSYCDLFREFINYHFRYDIKNIDEPAIIAYLRYLVMERRVSVSYQNQAINAIKFYYERVLGGQRKFYFIDRPLKEKTLPVVLSEEEVKAILRNVANIKHKALLMVAYSAGLRVSELVNLKIRDIDSQRMQIRISQSKGKKDRYTILSPKTLKVLRQYFKAYKPREWLFEGTGDAHYSARSVQEVLREVVKTAKINKHVTVHTLRHSFATHLLEHGTDLRYIQSLLGHGSSKTTEIYTHITTRGMKLIKSPVDHLDI